MPLSPKITPAGSAEVLAGLRHRFGTALILVTLYAGSFYGFAKLHGRSAVEDITRQPGGWPGALLVVAVSALGHELLHALGWMAFARLPWRAVTFRRTLRVMGFIAFTDSPIPVPAFRLSLLLPAVILGGGALALGLATGHGLFILWADFFLLECYSDITVLLATAGLQASAKVRDYPDRLGCRVDPLPLS